MRKLTIFLFAVVLIFAQIGMTKAEEILFEDFVDSSGLILAGCVPRGYWGIAPLEGIITLPSSFSQGNSSQDGNIFYGSYAKEHSGSPAATMTIVLPDLSGYTNLELTVALAASDGIFEPTHRDSLHIIGATTISLPDLGPCAPGGGCIPPVTGVIDSFLPITYPDYLRSKVYPPIGIGHAFQDFTYPIGSSLKSLTFAFASTDYPEKVGIDSVRIMGDPIVVPVDLDVKPGSAENCLNINGHGIIPVAILGSPDFDVLDINMDTLLFNGSQVQVRGNKEKTMCHLEDVSGDFTYPDGAPDGYLDLVCQFEDDPTQWETGQAEATLKGELYDGTPIEGTDVICIVP